MRFRSPRFLPFVMALLALAVAAGALLAAPAAARAARASKVLDQIAALNKKALAAHKAGSDDEARGYLLDAVVLAKKNALGKHELCARTYLNLGAVHIDGLNQREKGLRYLALAQRLHPGIQPTAALSNPKMRNALSEARRRQTELLAELEPADTGADHTPAREDDAGGERRTLASTAGGPSRSKDAKESKESRDAKEARPAREPAARVDDAEAAGGAAGDADLADTADEPLHCPAPEVAPPKRELNLRCFAGPKVQAERVTLHYRREAGDDYTSLRMNRGAKGWYTAAIPADDVTGKQLEFYVEAESSAGVAGTSGYEELPNVINLRRGAPPAGRVALSDVRMGSSALLREGGGEDAGAEASDEDEDGPSGRGGNRRPVGAFFVGLGLGSGYGAHLKRPLEHHAGREVSAGFAPGGLMQVMPEVGLQYDEHLSLSIQSRHQYIPASGGPDMTVSGDPPKTAHALLAHILYQLWGGERLQFLGSATLGGGSGFRLKVAEDPGAQLASSDTIDGGPVVLGPGVALYYNLNERFVITGESRLLLGLGNFAAVLEGALGLQYTFE